MSTIDREIKFCRDTRDYDCFVDGRYIGSTANHHTGELLCDQVARDMLTAGHFATATELDGGAVEMPEGDWLDVEGLRVVAPAGLVVVQVALDPPESLREDCLNVVTMALGQTHGAQSVVNELRRVKARLEAAGMSRIVALD